MHNWMVIYRAEKKNYEFNVLISEWDVRKDVKHCLHYISYNFNFLFTGILTLSK